MANDSHDEKGEQNLSNIIDQYSLSDVVRYRGSKRWQSVIPSGRRTRAEVLGSFRCWPSSPSRRPSERSL